MSKIVYKKLHCAMCGSENEYPVMMSRIVMNCSLEGKTFPTGTRLPVHRCPICGYSSYDIEREISEKQRRAYQTGEYQAVISQFPEDETGRARVLAAWLEQLEGTAAAEWLEATWYWEDCQQTDAAAQARRQAALGISEKMDQESVLDVPAAIVLIDSLRQLGEFAAAEEGICGLRSFVDLETPEQVALDLEEQAVTERNGNTLFLTDEVLP